MCPRFVTAPRNILPSAVIESLTFRTQSGSGLPREIMATSRASSWKRLYSAHALKISRIARRRALVFLRGAVAFLSIYRSPSGGNFGRCEKIRARDASGTRSKKSRSPESAPSTFNKAELAYSVIIPGHQGDSCGRCENIPRRPARGRETVAADGPARNTLFRAREISGLSEGRLQFCRRSDVSKNICGRFPGA